MQVEPVEGISVSDPLYHNGWEVIADPDGRITNLSDGQTYPYLFWESEGNATLQTPTEGFVVSRQDVASTLFDKLTLLGLNSQEIADFNEFWVPQMLSENKPYYFITFFSTTEIERTAPLTVTPKPDTIIRVLLGYKGLDHKIIVPELIIPTPPQRQGFTVIEWGGLL